MCNFCYGQGCYACKGYAAPKPAPPAPKVGELYAGRCKRCRGEALRVSKVQLDKLELFCKLCGETQVAKR